MDFFKEAWCVAEWKNIIGFYMFLVLLVGFVDCVMFFVVAEREGDAKMKRMYPLVGTFGLGLSVFGLLLPWYAWRFPHSSFIATSILAAVGAVGWIVYLIATRALKARA